MKLCYLQENEDPKIIMLGKISQTEKDKYYIVFSYVEPRPKKLNVRSVKW
jgi:hypothetical protein